MVTAEVVSTIQEIVQWSQAVVWIAAAWYFAKAVFGWGFGAKGKKEWGLGAKGGGKIRGWLGGAGKEIGKGLTRKEGEGKPGEEVPERKRKKAEKEEAAEEAFTIETLQEIEKFMKDTDKVIEDIRKEFSDKGKSVTDKDIDKVAKKIETLQGDLEKARKDSRKAVREARRIRRLLRDSRELKEEESKVYAEAQNISKAIGDLLWRIGKVMNKLKQIKDNKTKDGSPNGGFINNLLTMLAAFRRRGQEIREWLGVIIKHEEEIKKKT